MAMSISLPTVHSHSSAAQFLERMEPLLLAQEARYSLMLGIAVRVREHPDTYGDNPPYFAIAEDAAGIAAAASMTPPHGLIIFCERDDALPGLQAIADDLHMRGWNLPSVLGPEPVCSIFAQLWAAMHGLHAEIAVAERTFELRQVIPPRPSPGFMRQATADDAELLAQWFVDFNVEATYGIDPRSHEDMRNRMRDRVNEGMVYVWEDGEVVSLTGTTRPTTHGISIGPVYTPPEFRGRGYASNCVAAVSQRMLDQGREFCALFTDLANPTSNHIYQEIGYRAICDYTMYRFSKQHPQQ